MSRIVLAFKSFFAILFRGELPEEIARAFGYAKAPPARAAKSSPELTPSDGAVQLLAILQRDSRLVDFLMEDISPYSDEQIGAAVRTLHDQCRDALLRYIQLRPVVDGVEGTPTRIESPDPSAVKLIGNVPADGRAPQGILRHKGWRVERIELPRLSEPARILAPAEIEIE